jgi:hypothetical protein
MIRNFFTSHNLKLKLYCDKIMKKTTILACLDEDDIRDGNY